MIKQLQLGLLLLSVSITLSHSQHLLSDYTWKYRIIAYSLSSNEAANFAEQLVRLEAEIIERDVRFVALDQTVPSSKALHLGLSPSEKQRLYRSLKPKSTGTELILIGKDGGIKLRANQSELAPFFAIIDQMPMRRAEINRR